VHNSRRPCGAVSLSGDTAQRDGAAQLSRRDFFDPVTLTFDFHIILIGGRGIVMDYLCAKFGNSSFSHFHFIMRTDRHTDRITEADQRYTHATTVGVSSNSRRGDCLYPDNSGIVQHRGLQ